MSVCCRHTANHLVSLTFHRLGGTGDSGVCQWYDLCTTFAALLACLGDVFVASACLWGGRLTVAAGLGRTHDTGKRELGSMGEYVHEMAQAWQLMARHVSY